METQERFLAEVDLHKIPELRCQVLVIGSGIAGLTAARTASASADVILVSKMPLQESATRYAQGGIAAALGDADSPTMHIQDTVAAGQGLCDPDAVTCLATHGVEACRRLVETGVPFDYEGDALAMTMEGGHGQRRILHADGDATGRAIVQTLVQRIQERENVRIFEQHFVIDLLHHDGRCHGALLLDTQYGRLLVVRADATILAAGGLGQMFRETTNPPLSTADGYAMALRAGAILRDMEFIQFHPTTLYLAGAPRFLISEAVRGEGAHLINTSGERFMHRYHPAGELAPRDVVSRSIIEEMNRHGGTHVSLDVRHLDPARVAQRFPTILGICQMYGITPTTDLIPVRPAVHYAMGGVQVNMWAETGVARLLAVGEVASTGVHGANRLASNSLLEGLVFGERAGERAAALAEDPEAGCAFPLRHIRRHLSNRNAPLDLHDLTASLKALTWRSMGVYRDGEGLQKALETIRFWEQYVLHEQFQAQRGFEVQNMLTVARCIAHAALQREESRGAHQRKDFPDSAPGTPQHSHVSLATLEQDEG